MTKNVGSTDKMIRIVLAIILFSLFFILEGNLRFIALIGFVPLLTGLISWCPIYRIIGLNSCQLKKNQ